ncbi:MAG: NAD(P)-dependent oxidoreductase [Acidobacteriota bacterium]|jgi:D-3-phosphoglycerate dehydrogenase / 2-oxoglutarate reductase
MSQPKIVSIGPLPEPVSKALSRYGRVVAIEDNGLREDVLAAVDPEVILIVARGSVIVDAEILDRAPRLKAVSRTGVGFDSVCIPDATARRIPVLYTPGAMTRAVAEQTLAFMLAAAKKFSFWREALMAGDWNARYTTRSLDLQGATLGIIGYGRIGRQVRRLSRPLELSVLADDPYIDHSLYRDDDVEFLGLNELLSRASIITLHVPLTEETTGLINRENIRHVREGSILINTARGPVIENLDLLVEELESGRLLAVGIDVFPEEPPPADHPIFRHPRALLTGHVSARTPRAQKQILETMLEDTVAILEGRQPRLGNVVNPEVFGGPRP